jgi:tetratricopeptide (TPR) repeat protein
MGRVDLFGEASRSAVAAERPALAAVFDSVGAHERDYGTDKLPSLMRLAATLARYQAEVEPWLLIELQLRGSAWLQMLEDQVDHLPDAIYGTLPALYSLFVPLEAAARSERLREKVIRALMKMQSYAGALQMLRQSPDGDPRIIAECLEGLGEMEAAARDYLRAGRPQEALRCFRSIPDFDNSLQLLEGMPDHPARESLLWLRRMRDVAAERPPEFSKVIVPAEKKLLEQVLEASLGVTRKKAATKKSTKPGAKKPGKPSKKALF